jgi:hypothetical protein
MIFEILSVPGGGKTSLVNALQKQYCATVLVVPGISPARKMKDHVSNRQRYIFFAQLCAKYASPILLPVIVIYFRKYLGFLIRESSKGRIANVSNLKIIFYIMLCLSYQMLRYLFATLAAKVSGKHVCIDEGFLYNTIRFRTFLKPYVGMAGNQLLLHALEPLNIWLIHLRTPSNIALLRFHAREQGREDGLFKLWYFDKQSSDWMGVAWEHFDCWNRELMASREGRSQILSSTEISSAADELVDWLGRYDNE